jgi:hypothetical protein
MFDEQEGIEEAVMAYFIGMCENDFTSSRQD